MSGLFSIEKALGLPENCKDNNLVEESDEGARASFLEINKLCKIHNVNLKLAMEKLDKAEAYLNRECSLSEVNTLFYTELEHGSFDNTNTVPIGWKSTSSIERIQGREYGKGIED